MSSPISLRRYCCATTEGLFAFPVPNHAPLRLFHQTAAAQDLPSPPEPASASPIGNETRVISCTITALPEAANSRSYAVPPRCCLLFPTTQTVHHKRRSPLTGQFLAIVFSIWTEQLPSSRQLLELLTNQTPADPTIRQLRRW